MARGLFALAARYGRQPFEQAVIPAEQAARFGVPVSRAFARDIAVVAGPLSGDPVARSIFLAPGGGPLAEGAMLRQPELAATLGQMRMSGVGDLYSGSLARQMVQAANIAGGGLTLEAMRKALPVLSPVLTLPGPRGDQVAFLPPPADGGLAAAAAFKALQANPDDLASAQSRALAVAAAWRHGDTDVQALLDGPAPAAPALGHLPATTAFMALDKDGRFVGCAVSMNNLFGTGRVAPGTGVLLAASPASGPQPLLSVAMGYNANIHAFHGAATGTGQEGAPVAAAATIRQVLATRLPATPGISGANSTFNDRSVPYEASNPYASTQLTPAPDPGRANALSCSGYLPDDEGSCGWSVDPRGAGLAVGSN
jgi:gamma-glutamyltranspeptidase/glutathione hydrolase